MKSKKQCSEFLKYAAPVLLNYFEAMIQTRRLPGGKRLPFPICKKSWSEKDGAYVFSKGVCAKDNYGGPSLKVTFTITP